MIVINYSHPLTPNQQAQIERLTGQTIDRVHQVIVQFDQEQPFEPQIDHVIEASGLSGQDWQAQPILINPPALSSIAVGLLAKLHGIAGYFLPVIRLMRTETTPPTFEVAEILHLQDFRDRGRTLRNV